ncbi:MAG: hypothetical protein F6K24_31900 [Okeania sp. SIO2D1]|nr:hypothetical protein [Okeania sp. SIO2D1]
MVSTAIYSAELKQLSQTGDHLFDLGQFETALNKQRALGRKERDDDDAGQ